MGTDFVNHRLLSPDAAARNGPYGFSFWNDFESSAALSTTGIGDSGGVVDFLTPNTNTWKDCGLIKITTAAVTDNGAGLHLNQTDTSPFYGTPPTGTRNFMKLRLDGTATQFNAWAGLFHSATTIPDAAKRNTVHGIGVVARATTAGVNWFGICRSGTDETTVDLEVAADTTFRHIGWVKTAGGIQFMVSDKAVGTEVTTNIPSSTQALAMVISITAASAAARDLVVDFYGLTTTTKRF
tara:strand:- start:452 stop:1168 length:717 start_codon:yes stop_codon:yes gene_type:complete